MLGWHPPAELSAWARAEAERRNTPLSVILTEALAEYRMRRSWSGTGRVVIHKDSDPLNNDRANLEVTEFEGASTR